MAVTDDKYELPLCVYDTRRELAEAYSVSEKTIKAAVRKDSRSRYLNLKFVRVKVEGEQ